MDAGPQQPPPPSLLERAREACREARQQRERTHDALLRCQWELVGPNPIVHDAVVRRACIEYLERRIMLAAAEGRGSVTVLFNEVPAFGERMARTEPHELVWRIDTTQGARAIASAFKELHPEFQEPTFVLNQSWRFDFEPERK